MKSGEDKECQERLNRLETVYPGAKTAAFYQRLADGGFNVVLPEETLTPECEDREAFDRILAEFILDGIHLAVLGDLEEYVVDYDFGTPSFREDEMTGEQRSVLLLARTVHEVFYSFLAEAPASVGNSFFYSVTEAICEKHTGLSRQELLKPSQDDRNRGASR